MKYLRKYETVNDVDPYVHKTGYTQQELTNILLLNLEDNSEFEVLDISISIPSTPFALLKYATSHSNRPVLIELQEDFSNNSKYNDVSIGPANRFRDYIKPLIHDANKKVLDIIGKKYDLAISVIEINPGLQIYGHLSLVLLVKKLQTINL